jgi:uncharacterized protein
MSLFLLVFLSVYGGANLYVFWRFAAAFGLRGWALLPAGLLVAFMVAAPLLVYAVERWGSFTVARLLSWPAYTWMALAFWAFCLFLARDLWNLVVRTATLAAPPAAVLKSALLPARASAIAVLALLAVAGAWSLYEAWDIRLERVTVRTPHLAPGSPPVTIAQISDVHLGLIFRHARLAKVVALVREANPDLLVSTGDLVDLPAHYLDGISEQLAALAPPLGKFAVTGNHDYYNGLAEALDFHRRAGFLMLRQEAVEVGRGADGKPILMVAGVDDPAGKSEARNLGESRIDEDALLPRGERSLPVLLLKHRPLLAPGSAGRFDLQLSGHAHKGQIWPFRYLSALANPMLDGLYPLPGGSFLYASRGTGTWGPPMRLFARPEVTLITLAPAG